MVMNPIVQSNKFTLNKQTKVYYQTHTMDYPHKKSLQLTIRPLCSEIVFDSPQYGVMFF